MWCCDDPTPITAYRAKDKSVSPMCRYALSKVMGRYRIRMQTITCWRPVMLAIRYYVRTWYDPYYIV